MKSTVKKEWGKFVEYQEGKDGIMYPIIGMTFLVMIILFLLLPAMVPILPLSKLGTLGIIVEYVAAIAACIDIFIAFTIPCEIF